jgi:hypothetical protein
MITFFITDLLRSEAYSPHVPEKKCPSTDPAWYVRVGLHAQLVLKQRRRMRHDRQHEREKKQQKNENDKNG